MNKKSDPLNVHLCSYRDEVLTITANAVCNLAHISRSAGLLLVVLMVLLAGCSMAPAPVSPPPAPIPEIGKVQAAVRAQAMDLIGTPYRYGGASPATGFDCSGLVCYVYLEAAGIKLPRTTAELNELKTDRPPIDALQPGDLLLFKAADGHKVNHVGIYTGDGCFVHAPSSGGRVRIDLLEDRYWQRAYTGARRVVH